MTDVLSNIASSLESVKVQLVQLEMKVQERLSSPHCVENYQGAPQQEEKYPKLTTKATHLQVRYISVVIVYQTM